MGRPIGKQYNTFNGFSAKHVCVAAEYPHMTALQQFDAPGPTFILHQNLYLFNFYKIKFWALDFYV